jgi:hypothetical protein
VVAPKPWPNSEEERKARKSRKTTYIVAVTVGLVAAATGVVGVSYSANGGDPFWWYFAAVASGYFAGLLALIAHMSYNGERTKFNEREATIAEAASRERIGQLIVDELSLESVFVNNRSAVERYHHLTQAQAEKAFNNCQAAMMVGLGLLVLGGIVILSGVPTPTKITVGVLTGIATLVSGYVTRTFLRTYSDTITQMNKLYQQPVVSGYLIHAERVAMSLGDARENALETLISECVNAARSVQGRPRAETPSHGRSRQRSGLRQDEMPVAL